ncbi:MAG: glycosyltransferase family 4 protein [Proteobacteria bacterium]|nr:glycosyltransferase family 4 protein [Pseudomonadota bacterium]
MNRKTKILRIIARLNIGGPAIHVALLTQGLDPDRFQSVLVTGKVSAQEGDMSYLADTYGIKPIVISDLQREINFKKDLKTFIKVFAIIRREKPDIVHSHTAKAGFVARIAVCAYNFFFNKKVKVVHTFHGHVFKGYFSRIKTFLFLWVERLLARSTDVVIAISDSQKKELADKYRIISPDKIKIINLGFDLNPFLFSKALHGKFRRFLGIDNKTLLIGIVGRLVPIKNHMMFLKAAKIFINQNPGIRVKFVVVGDGEMRGELEAYCSKEGLSEHVLFCGWVRDVASVYADIDILALTSLNEGTPVSIIEAMASSVPVIATDVGGIKDLLGFYISNDYTANGFQLCERGILCENKDPQHFAKGLSYLLNNGLDKDESRIMRALEYVKQNYSQERLIRDIKALYIDLAGLK